MNELHDNQTEESIVFDLEPTYNRHYITIDARNRVTAAWSDGPHRDKDTSGAICINDKGGYQFRLNPDGEENPPLYTMDGMPLYRWDGEQVIARTEEEIAADRIPPLEVAQAAKLAELSAACGAAITAGCDVETSQGVEHFSLQETDQINLSTALSSVQAGAEGYPYHADGTLCRMFSAAEIEAIAEASVRHKLYHTTYYNHLAAWVRCCKTVEELETITYGADLPDDLAANMADILAAAGA